jgi:NADH-quinone oxidoreductase subunit C
MSDYQVLLDSIKQKLGESVLDVSEKAGDIHLELLPDALMVAGLFLRDDPDFVCDFLADLTARDTGTQFILWIRLFSTKYNRTIIVKTAVDRESPVVPSLTAVWPGADWFERECFDMYGIDFDDHPFQGDLAQMRILLPMDWDGFPFRKDYKPVFSGDPLHGPQETN